MPILPLHAPIVNLTIGRERHSLRAPKGGCTVGGRTFKGGQFWLPCDPAAPHGLKAEAPAPGVDLTRFASRTMLVGDAPTRLAINGFTYIARKIPAGECGTIAYRLEKRDTGHAYDVIRNHFGEVTCDCPDYLMRRDGHGTMCKHGRRLVELGMVPAPTVAPARLPDPIRIDFPSRRRRFAPTPDEMAEAAQLFGDL